jgi:hypothetical protein
MRDNRLNLVLLRSDLEIRRRRRQPQAAFVSPIVVTVLSTRHVKVLVLICVSLAVLFVSVALRPNRASAKLEDALETLASYRTWTKITKEPIKGAGLQAVADLVVASELGGG